MQDQRKTKSQLIEELSELRGRLAAGERPGPEQGPDLYQSAFAQAALGMAVLSLEGRFLRANRHLGEMLGYSEHELCALGLAELTPPEDRPSLAALLGQMRQRGVRVVQEQRRLTHRFGHGLWVLIKSTLVSDRQGRPRHLVCLFMDVTQQRLAEAALQESEEKYRTIFETTGTAMIIIEEDTTISLANHEFAALTGQRREAFEGGRSWTEFMADHDLPRMLAYHNLRRTNPGEAPNTYEAQVKDGRGGLRHCLLNVAVIPGTMRSVASLLDTTERRRVETERALLAAAMEQAAEGVVVTDARGVVLYVNHSFERLTGYRRLEVEGQDLRALDRLGGRGWSFPPALWEAFTRGLVWSGRFASKRRDGEPVEMEATVSPVRDADGALTNFVVLTRDATVEARLEAQLRQAQKMEAIGTLAGGVAHDFNNILASILGYTEIALHDYLPEGHAARLPLTEVVKACRRARDLAEQILAFSRRGAEERRPLNVSSVVKEGLRLLRATLPATIHMRQRIAPALNAGAGVILGHPTQLHQVLINLCTNAAHAMGPPGGELDVDLDLAILEQDSPERPPDLKPGRYVVLSVSDTGRGMEPQVLERIFEPYFTTKGPGEGTGLGLSVVHGIVQSHQGAISVQSRPGQGTTFRVFFPEAPAQVAPEPLPAELATGRGERVLLVDDEPGVVDMARTMLANLGYRVSAFLDPREALQAFQVTPWDFDLVITDQTMPQLTGGELAQALLALRPGLPIILCSGFSGQLSREDLLGLGINRFLPKPIERQELAQSVRQALDEAGRPRG